MKKNDLIKVQNTTYRILGIRDNKLLCINCLEASMPTWLQIPEHYSSIDEDELYHATNTLKEDISNISPARRKVAYERFSIIAGIVASIDDKPHYIQQINSVSASSGLSKQTIRSHLIKYLIYQNIAVLAPKQPSETRSLSNDEKNFRWALNKYFYNQNQHTLVYTYKTMLQKKYCDSDGKLLQQRPSYNQFYYYYRRNRHLQNYLISRNGLGDYQRNERPLLGDGVQEFAPNLGIGMLDGTICDIYLVNEAGDVIGRPVLTACIDANTSLLMGYCLSLEGGMYNIRNLMLNIITDKVEWCKRFNIQITEDEWRVSSLPGKFVTDKGSEYISENFSQLADLGITLVDLPAFRPDLKSYVEKAFDILQGLFKQELKGKGVVEKDFSDRTNRTDYRKQACLTLSQFETILLRCILYYNNHRLLENYPYTDEMLHSGIKPYASSVWNNRLNEISSDLRTLDEQTLALTLLPRTNGKFTRQGLKVNQLRYSANGFTEEFLSGGDVIVAYSPDDVSRVWLYRNNEYFEFKLIENRFVGKSLQTVEELLALQRQLLNKESENNMQAKIDLSNQITNITKSVPIMNNPNIKTIRKNRTRSKTKIHKEIGSEIE